MAKMLAVDLDGTLLNHDNTISEENISAIKHAFSQGIEVIVATGRAYFDVVNIFKDSGIKTWVIAANGATIHSPSGELLHSIPMEKCMVLDALKWLEANDFYYEVFTDTCILTPQKGRELLQIEMDRVKSANPKADMNKLIDAAEKQYSQTGFKFIKSSEELINSTAEFYNILAFSFFEDRLKMGWRNFESMRGLTLVTSANHNFELEHKEASKGNALRMLAAHLGVPMVETVAVGDSHNDISMLTAAGKGVAMGNARKDVKDVCSEMTLSNDQHGVAHLIYKLTKEVTIQ